MADKRSNTETAEGDSTHLDTTTKAIQPTIPAKKPHLRSADRSAADYLQEQHRVGQFNQFPLRKHRYINLYTTRLLDALVVLYVHFFKLNWEKFARAAEKFSLPSGIPDHFHLLAYTYISHWANDLYYSIRKSCASTNPLAFVEKYHQENARYADRYDNFLALLINAIRPTPIVGAIADEVYIPVLGTSIDFTKKTKVFNWNHWHIDMTIFQLTHQTLELKKIVKFVPISDDPTGRPVWLFDWFDNQAYSWFPFEQNYNEIDISVAYVLGVACTPKVSLPDTDDWRYLPAKASLKNLDINSIPRVTPRRKHGNSEHRTLESEEIVLPNYYEADKDKFAKFNVGPLAIKKLSSDDEAETSEQVDPDYVPESPRPLTRSQATDTVERSIRIRVHDYLYYTKVIDTTENATRFAAFKIFMQPPV